eukprot:2325911-Rhodomonas_salina.1
MWFVTKSDVGRTCSATSTRRAPRDSAHTGRRKKQIGEQDCVAVQNPGLDAHEHIMMLQYVGLVIKCDMRCDSFVLTKPGGGGPYRHAT